METTLQQQFHDLLDVYRTSKSNHKHIKQFVLNNQNSFEEIQTLIYEYLALVQCEQDIYGLALAYILLFFTTWTRDLDQAIIYNEKARDLLLSDSCLSLKEEMLSVKNNAVLAFISKEDYASAYIEIQSALAFAKENKFPNFLPTLMHNGAILLCEFGMYKKAIQQLEENLQKHNFSNNQNYITTLYLLSSLYANTSRLDKMKQLLDENINGFINSKEFQSTALCISLRYYLLKEDSEQIEYYFQKLFNSYDFNSYDIMETSEVNLMIARYYTYRKEYQKALTYYKEIELRMDHLLGMKRLVLEEIASLYEELEEHERSYEYLQLAHTKRKQYISFIDDIYRKEIEDIWEANRQLTFDVLYDRLLAITEFGKLVTNCTTYHELYTITRNNLSAIFSYDESELLLYNHDINIFYNLNQETYTLVDNTLLASCLDTKEAIYYGNIQSTKKLMQSLFYTKNPFTPFSFNLFFRFQK